MRCLQELQAAALQIGDRLRSLQDELCLKEGTLSELCEKHQDARQQIEAQSSQVQYFLHVFQNQSRICT